MNYKQSLTYLREKSTIQSDADNDMKREMEWRDMIDWRKYVK